MMKQSNIKLNDNVKVIVRVRPPLQRELEGDIFISTVQVHPDKQKIQIFQYYNLDTLTQNDLESYIDNPYNYNKHEYCFDHVYDDQASQQQVYQNTARLSVCSALQGYNATIFAYGQTGTGKTFTMEGFKYNMHDDERGIIPRAVQDIFRYIQSCQDQDTTFMVRASYIQIYNEVISDLLRHQKKNLQIREDSKKGVYVEGASEWAVVRPQQILQLMKMGAKSRATAKTNMNQSSSRSHAVFIITIQQMKQNETTHGRQLKVAKLNLVDLAGSERVRVTGASGKRLDQCKNINLSLSCLGMVIGALTQYKQQSHIPYRNSVLTRLLSDSLGGNCKTTMLTMISPAPEAFQESLSSLKFAHRAKSIKNKPAINQDLDQKALIRKYQVELKKLRGELQQKNKVLIDKTKLIQLQEEKKQIQQDKKNVMMALQQRSNQFFKERQQKKMLEQKIKAYNSQLIHCGMPLQKAFHEQKKIIQEYQKKIKSLESQKGKGQQYLFSNEFVQKQNQILNNFALKLNERDQVNKHLNEQLYAYDQITKQRQQLLQRKEQRIAQLQSIIIKNGLSLPKDIQQNYPQLTTKKSKFDGVEMEGEITYNISQKNFKNLKQTEQEINALKQVNGQQKKQIVRLKQQLNKHSSISTISQQSFSQMSSVSSKVSQDKNGYHNIKDSIDLITKGLQQKQNKDMKVIINQLFKIKKIVQQNI